MNYQQQAIKAYQQVDKQADQQQTDPYKVIAILMTNALEAVHIAELTMAQNLVEEKGRFISLAISLIDGLRASLDKEQGGDIAQNLDDLYDYMMRRLVEANLHNDPEMLQEVHGLLSTIKEGWDGIKDYAEQSQNENK